MTRVDEVDVYEQERRYRAVTGDKPRFLGFERRLAEWLEKNPRRELANQTANLCQNDPHRE